MKPSNQHRPRVGISLYGGPAVEKTLKVSGLIGFQKLFCDMLITHGVDVVPFCFSDAGPSWSKDTSYHLSPEGRHIFHLCRADRVMALPSESIEAGIPYPNSWRRFSDELVAFYKREHLDALQIIEWLPAGMAVWESALNSGIPVCFTPTEHGSVCQYGFLLNNCGSACSGPGDGEKCARCTHGLEPFPPTRSTKEHWYSRRHRLFHSATAWLTPSLQKPTLEILSNSFQHPGAVLSPTEGRARLASARRFLSSPKIRVAYQSEHQHRVFERALGIPLASPLTRAVSTLPSLESAPNRLPVKITEPVHFLFAARPSFDRGLWLLLDAWRKSRPPANRAVLEIYTDPDGKWLTKSVRDLCSLGCDVRLYYGRLARDRIARVYCSAHFVINPAVWEEPGSATVTEALHFGTPAIVPTSTGSADYVQDAVNGYQFEFRNLDSLVSTLERAVAKIDRWSSLHIASLESARLAREATFRHRREWFSELLPNFSPEMEPTA